MLYAKNKEAGFQLMSMVIRVESFARGLQPRESGSCPTELLKYVKMQYELDFKQE